MGFGLTPLLGDRRGFMPPQLKTNKQTKQLHTLKQVTISDNVFFQRIWEIETNNPSYLHS